jgi:hypothetical protein
MLSGRDRFLSLCSLVRMTGFDPVPVSGQRQLAGSQFETGEDGDSSRQNLPEIEPEIDVYAERPSSLRACWP